MVWRANYSQPTQQQAGSGLKGGWTNPTSHTPRLARISWAMAESSHAHAALQVYASASSHCLLLSLSLVWVCGG